MRSVLEVIACITGGWIGRPAISSMADDVRSKIDVILNNQELDAARRIEQGWYYGDTGEIVLGVVEQVREAVESAFEESVRRNSLAPVIRSVAQAKEAYKSACVFDDDGYGLATFNEILRDLGEMQVRFGDRRSQVI